MLAFLYFSLFAVSNAGIQWSIGETADDLNRRLALALTSSTTDYNSSSCIVGGADLDHPEKVYVGGPCNQLDVSNPNSPKPMTGFRWVTMEVVRAGLRKSGAEVGDASAEAELEEVANSAFQTSSDTADYGMVGTGVHAKVKDKDAKIVTGQASYLAKKAGTFATNTFAFAKDGNGGVTTATMCVAACCNSPPCACTSCPAESAGISYSPGDYKFSVYLASTDDGSTDTTKNWASIVEAYGEGTPKELKGDFYVDQVVDFSNMQADTLEITTTDNSVVTYATMDQFDGTAATKAAIYSVKSVKIKSPEWTGSYAFPNTYNKGSWSNGGATITPERTETVKIFCIRISNENLGKLGVANAASKKIVLFRYQFDITGVTADANSGKWMAYDPTITSEAGSTGTSDSGSTGGIAGGSSGLLPSCVLLASAIVVLLFKD